MKKLFRFNSIKKKILFGFSIVLFLVLVLSAYNFLAIKALNDNTDEITKEELPRLIIDDGIAFNMSERTSLLRGYVLYGDPQLKDLFNEFTDESLELENELLEVNESDEIYELIKQQRVWEEAADEVFELYDAGNMDEAMEVLENEVRPIENDVLIRYKELAESRETEIFNIASKIETYGNTSLIIETIISLIVLIIGIVIALLIARMISKPIVTVMNRMRSVADGDLSHEALQTKATDETGQLVAATNEMSENTKNLLRKINEVSESVSTQSKELTQSADEVKSGTEQIATTMEELATGSESQANSASDLSSAMGLFTTKVGEANENGEMIEQNSTKVLEMTGQGSEMMRTSTDQMAKINHIVKDSLEKMRVLDNQSQEISKLVSVIKDVADQTNLLALNAAIEAARAGEHGKGFAVVADEVRTLAEQVALSVSDITRIVDSIQTETTVVADSLENGYTEVEEGSAQIVTTGETFKEISSSVTDMVQNISAVSDNLAEIVANSRQMNSSIEEIASVSEEAAAGVEETAASAEQSSGSMEEMAGSSEHLAKLAEELNDLIGQFKL